MKLKFKIIIIISIVTALIIGIVACEKMKMYNEKATPVEVVSKKAEDKKEAAIYNKTVTPIQNPTYSPTPTPTATPEPTPEPIEEQAVEIVEETPVEDVEYVDYEEDVQYEEYQEDNSSTEMTYFGECTVSFYDGCEGCNGSWTNAENIGAAGVPLSAWYSCANGELPFGTIVYIEGIGQFVVQDRGVESMWFDIFVNNHGEIPSYGITTASVYIVG